MAKRPKLDPLAKFHPVTFSLFLTLLSIVSCAVVRHARGSGPYRPPTGTLQGQIVHPERSGEPCTATCVRGGAWGGCETVRSGVITKAPRGRLSERWETTSRKGSQPCAWIPLRIVSAPIRRPSPADRTGRAKRIRVLAVKLAR